jgi:hypothetical protein
MMWKFLRTLAVLFALAFPVQAATTYHVVASGGGGTACTQPAPCSSIATGISKLAAGDTLEIHGGTYSGQSLISVGQAIANGTAWSNPTTVKASTGETVTLRGGALDVNGYGSTTYKYLIFSGFIFDGSLDGQGVSIQGPLVSYVRLQDSEIKNTNDSCIFMYDTIGLEFLRNNIHHCGNSTGDHGLYGAFSHGLIEGNDIHDCPGYGLQFYQSSGGDGTPCHYPGPGLDAFNCGSHTVIRNNKFHNNTSVSFGGALIGTGDNIQFYNNLVYNNRVGLTVGYAHANNTQIYNNTVYGNSDTAVLIHNYFGGSVTNTLVKNNIVFGNTGSAFVLGDGGGGPPTGTVFAKNLCGAGGLGCTNVGNPRFDNASGGVFTLQLGSDARNVGDTLTTFNTDFAGLTRPQGIAWDIGAYEYPEGGGVTPTGNPIYLSGGGHSDTPSDAGDCTVPENIATPRATLSAALACMTVPGKTLYLRGGTYAGALDTGSGLVGGTSASTPTRIEGYQSEAVTLQLPVGGSVGLFVRDVSYVAVAKLTVDAMARIDSNAFACVNADHITLTQVTARNSYYEPAYLSGCSDSTFTQSLFHTAQVAPVFTMDGTSSQVTLDQVELHTGTVQGLNANVNSGSNTNLVVTRTQIHGTGTGAGTTHALDLGPGTGALLVNNIVDHNKAGVRIRSGAGTVKVYHNALASNTPGTALQCDSGATSVTITNNISFGNGTDAVVNNCGALLATNLDNGTDPQWVNVAARDFHTQLTSGAINTGTALPEVTMAIDGTVRPVGLLYDQGPYETTVTVLPGDPTPPPLVLIRRWLGMLY